MKFKLIATLLGLAIAGGANAAIDLSVSNNGELFLQLWDDNGTTDKADDRNYVRDLGSLVNGSVAGGKLNNWASAVATPVLVADKLVPQVGGIFSLGADANLTSFLTGTTNLARLRWNITAVDTNGIDRFLTTSSSITAANLPTYAEFRAFGTQADGFLYTANAALGPTGESVVLTGTNTGLTQLNNNVAGNARFTTDGAVGDQLGFFLLSEKVAAGSAPTKATLNQFSDAAGTALTWQFKNDGSLVYGAAVTAVPEPENYALFLAGLGLIGAIARRRMVK